MSDLEKKILDIEERNHRVEMDKAWEASWFRRGLLAVFTYIVIGLFLLMIHVSYPWINALVPVMGFLISTLTLSFCKHLWKKYVYHKTE